MRNYKYLALGLLAAVALTTSCSKDSEGKTWVEEYPKIMLNGDAFTISPIGETYNDAGCTCTYDNADYTSHVVTTGVDAIDVNAPGLYYVTYTATSPHGYSWSEQRTVAVCDPSVTTDLAGTWKTQTGTNRNNNAGKTTEYSNTSVTIKKLCPGIFSISDFMAGYYAQVVYSDAKYASYDFNLDGIFQLTSDNKIVKLSTGAVSAFGDDGTCEVKNGKYDPATGEISFTVVWSGMDFNVILKQ